jgi:hypothetical protein
MVNVSRASITKLIVLDQPVKCYSRADILYICDICRTFEIMVEKIETIYVNHTNY